MELLIWPVIVGGTAFMIWYGYGLLARRPGASGADGAAGPRALCHLCRREFPVDQMVTREKLAGFENHFCGDCIERLHDDYLKKFRDGERSGRDHPGQAVSRN